MSNEAKWSPVIKSDKDGVLVDGFPSYLREPVLSWLKPRAGVNHDFFDPSFFVEFQSAAQVDLGFRGGYTQWTDTVAPLLRKADDAVITNLVDFAVFKTGGYKAPRDALEVILRNGSSKWRVAESGNKGRLVERVPEGVQKVMDEAFDVSHLASEKLKEAWVDAYGVSPRPSVAYQHAVIAVEIAALSVITVNKPDPTLGDVITILESQQAKWNLPFRDSDKAPRIEVLAKMMRLLWRGQASRHGRPDYTDATDEEARGAVLLAATLVGWLTSGLLVKKSDSSA
jgi:hypothetical protein